MKELGSFLQTYQPEKGDKNDPIIEVLIRRGNGSQLQKPKLCSEMICQDCGGHTGVDCLHCGKKAWFCDNPQCMKIDTEISKINERNLWKQKMRKEQEEAERKKANKEWDGK